MSSHTQRNGAKAQAKARRRAETQARQDQLVSQFAFVNDVLIDPKFELTDEQVGVRNYLRPLSEQHIAVAYWVARIVLEVENPALLRPPTEEELAKQSAAFQRLEEEQAAWSKVQGEVAEYVYAVVSQMPTPNAIHAMTELVKLFAPGGEVRFRQLKAANLTQDQRLASEYLQGIADAHPALAAQVRIIIQEVEADQHHRELTPAEERAMDEAIERQKRASERWTDDQKVLALYILDLLEEYMTGRAVDAMTAIVDLAGRLRFSPRRVAS